MPKHAFLGPSGYMMVEGLRFPTQPVVNTQGACPIGLDWGFRDGLEKGLHPAAQLAGAVEDRQT